MKKMVVMAFLATSLVWMPSCEAQIGIGFGTGGVGVGFNLGSNRMRPERSLEKEVQYLKKELDLSRSQETAVRESILDREQDGSRQGREAACRRFEEDMKDILTPEQFEKYLEISQERKSSGKKTSREKQKQKQELPREQWDDVYR